ncbi:ATP-binding protein [Flavobacterium sp. 14A]|uniref:sensor histidine kinase n=1 Tax=Flavobacterium sp. 14A TaxID=2735896 RepID=UPI00156E0BD2|nr:ATP-binding protein [Flavobacterium sp. 14A]NRT13249.1 light-regulated signal transduction histidine kinase (bacteriophytochrome) [Flavobacterium sp. 14A]
MHPLLKRQIDKKLKGGLNDLDVFLGAVDESYLNYESQIDMLQRAMKISSDELFDANQKLRDEAESLKEVNKNLQNILESMSLDPELTSLKDNFDSSDYIKQQSIEIVKINKQREELLGNLEKQNVALSEYAHMVSHDLKSPLRTIDTLINWFIQDNQEIMNETNLKSLNRILSNVEKMDLLIKGILNYSSIESLSHETRMIDLNIMVSDLLKAMTVGEQVSVSIANPLPKIVGNDFRMKQLFQNIIENAIKYNDKENPIVTISSSEDEQEYTFQIADNGVGIAAAYQSKIFEVFSKLQNDGNSSGIGLSIVKKIIEYYKGRIWLESQEKVGSTFYFTIPKTNGAA